MANKLRSLLGASAVGLASLVTPTKSDAAIVVNYTPDQIGSVSAPVEGLGATSSDYLLTGFGGTSTLDKNSTGTTNEVRRKSVLNPS